MNWRKYIDKLLYNLKLKFKSKEELLTEEVLLLILNIRI